MSDVPTDKCLRYVFVVSIICAVSSIFWGGAGFWTSLAKRKTVVQLGSLGRGGVAWKPSLVGSRGETPESCDYFVF